MPQRANLAVVPNACRGHAAPVAFATAPGRRPALVAAPVPAANQLLAHLPEAVRQSWLPHLEAVDLRLGQVLCESGGTLSHLYFPVDATVSLLYVTESGASAEIGVVGNEGVVGIAVVMGGETTPSRAVVQLPGRGFRLATRYVREELKGSGPVLQLLLRYTQALITQTAQTAVCNRFHSIDQQLCRWLLQCLDRLSGCELHVTQEAIGNMLGVRREGITEAALGLQAVGLISYSRGHIRVLDRGGLERRSCECYDVVRREYARLLSASPAH